MKLFTTKLEKRFAEVGSQRDQADPLVIAKFHLKGGAVVWYATEYNPETRIYFGYATNGIKSSWGHFRFFDNETTDTSSGILIERDQHFKEMPISEVVPDLKLSIQEIKLKQIRDQVEENRVKDLGNEH